jgi:hypothetical protein
MPVVEICPDVGLIAKSPIISPEEMENVNC